MQLFIQDWTLELSNYFCTLSCQTNHEMFSCQRGCCFGFKDWFSALFYTGSDDLEENIHPGPAIG
jgi:hypothetical protein